MDDKKIKAVYYPYSIIPDKLLKQLVLYFDEITLCLPQCFEIPPEYQYFHENKLINVVKNPTGRPICKAFPKLREIQESLQPFHATPQKLPQDEPLPFVKTKNELS